MTAEPVLLAFDTSTSIGSVAVGRGEDVLASGFITRRGEHAARLVPLIERVLGDAGIERSEIGGLVVGRGPGSFTGVRIAAATAKGLVRGLGCPLWLHSSLAAGAASLGLILREPLPSSDPAGRSFPWEATLPTDPRPRYVLFDARGDRVYGGCYRFGPDGLETEAPPHAATIAEILEAGTPAEALFCGDGAVRHGETLTAAGYTVIGPPAGVPTAEGLLRLHRMSPEVARDGRENRWEPEYLRPSSARRPAPAGGSTG